MIHATCHEPSCCVGYLLLSRIMGPPTLPPETVLEIAKYLAPLDLLAFSLVCRLWSACAICRLDSYWQTSLFVMNHPPNKSAITELHRLAGLLYNASICEPGLTRYWREVNVSMRAVFSQQPESSTTFGWPCAIAMADILHNMTGVERLTIQFGCVEAHDLPRLQPFFGYIKPVCGTVTILAFDGCSPHCADIITVLVKSAPKLQEVHIRGNLDHLGAELERALFRRDRPAKLHHPDRQVRAYSPPPRTLGTFEPSETQHPLRRMRRCLSQ
ncbi:hypothetical protein BC937DRAFT_91692 [Endogone sp. FLAS-F59071]|nr:hypothetical protein BC937DRAFT_91692 [Endogone sp. FLAS-F59071]|eukprot:RUS16019.1 hypothetical protein BC937DRAFT_91692 [Endogone sp. FLAS-F59071]